VVYTTLEAVDCLIAAEPKHPVLTCDAVTSRDAER